MDDIKRDLQNRLLAEHAEISEFVAHEMTVTGLIRALTVVAWLPSMVWAAASEIPALPLALVVWTALIATWLTDVWFSYVGVIYKMRRLKLREWIAALPDSAAQTVADWKTPVNPFDGLSRSDKMSALKGTLLSPSVLLVYLLLDVATVAFLLVR